MSENCERDEKHRHKEEDEDRLPAAVVHLIIVSLIMPCPNGHTVIVANARKRASMRASVGVDSAQAY